MAYSQIDIDKLKKAIAQGATKVKFADREVTYRDLDDMVETLRIMQREVNEAYGLFPKRRSRTIRFVTGKGLC